MIIKLFSEIKGMLIAQNYPDVSEITKEIMGKNPKSSGASLKEGMHVM